MRELHLFAGVGGGILGGMLLGHTCVCAVEINVYCQKVLLQRQRDGILPIFPIWGDIKTFDGVPWKSRVDAVRGGFPCPDISRAGKKEGITGERSGLWRDMARVVREVEPSEVSVENVSALTIRGIDIVLRDLAEMGFDASWGVFSAADAGARHERERIWIEASHPDRSGLQRSERRAEARFFKVDDLASPKVFPQHEIDLPEPRLLGSGHGMANFVDRSKAIGNGQVPAVVAMAYKILRSHL